MPEPADVRKLILVFNADSGKLNALVDSAKKLLHIESCALCSITHGLFGEKSEWRRCRDELGVPVELVHRDELAGPLRDVVAGRLPCVVVETDDGLQMLLTPDDLHGCRRSVASFKHRLLNHASMYDLEIAGGSTSV